jgi:hypothetical protein
MEEVIVSNEAQNCGEDLGVAGFKRGNSLELRNKQDPKRHAQIDGDDGEG